MNKKGLTASFIFEAESTNYGEGIGNVAVLKKISRGNGEAYTYISRQALRYNIVEQMGVSQTPLNLDGTVIQFHPDATIEEYSEIDLFGYMKTKKPAKSRAAVVRLSNGIALESYQSDLDYLTNKGLLDRYNQQTDKVKEGGNIAQSEIHKSYYAYTLTIDLDKVGIDNNDQIEISNDEKENRVNHLLDTVKFLYRDIKGRRENLSPFFAVGGVYDIKNPFFENKLKVKDNRLQTTTIQHVLNLDAQVKEQTKIGYIQGIFNNDVEIELELNPVSIGEFFAQLKESVSLYYNK
ncbi:type I-B CRISPR-associated protein Cas7/Cst2/DevR [Priestia megaterium]|nr:type I-B CRISPR-associated protein Cas7/Cst2/DevR [Priestia megaterium]